MFNHNDQCLLSNLKIKICSKIFLDYFNYGFNEDTWKKYVERQKRIRSETKSNVNSSCNISSPSIHQSLSTMHLGKQDRKINANIRSNIVSRYPHHNKLPFIQVRLHLLYSSGVFFRWGMGRYHWHNWLKKLERLTLKGIILLEMPKIHPPSILKCLKKFEK